MLTRTLSLALLAGIVVACSLTTTAAPARTALRVQGQPPPTDGPFAVARDLDKLRMVRDYVTFANQLNPSATDVEVLWLAAFYLGVPGWRPQDGIGPILARIP